MRKLFTLLTAAVSLFAIESAQAATIENNNESQSNVTVAESKTARVSAGDIEYFTFNATAGASASVLIVGDGDTDLDLYIFDANSNIVVSDTDDLDVCLCEWTATYTGQYYVAVKNYGNVYNEFTIVANME